MNRTDRLLAIVLELQAHGARRAEDLAGTFEVSRRTIYRDVQALCEAGVPVVAEPGRGYSLPAGYFLPPLRFSADEALMLILGAGVAAQSFDAEYRLAAESAARKIAGALPEERRGEVLALRASLELIESAGVAPHAAEMLRQLRMAVVRGQRVRLRYRARFGADGPGEVSSRLADPYGLVRIGGAWYLVAHCHLRGDIRNFRLDRIAELELIAERFTRPPGYALSQPSERRPIVARVRFTPEAAPWVREAPSFYIEELRDEPEGLLATLRLRRLDEIMPWLLSWGARATVLEPPELREMVRAEARAMLSVEC
ncbi:YafY family transcriptional regulator [Oscillochloris sp. ZM17-4]|uniref:helix-turn-helix transcriptional regulator n=1 Tax=Oscillochloris sp. ZM17-4 TaxID=2866714 RepID=UPI001C73127F|nr:YafY family protein [Oscillochloris sp. ZM17-4]MBX0327498.1 YafY family transcriptional regulator [Oscillochloris sp. ZM17-4]